ncbi:MAG: NAD(P)-dependent oxidoreductase [Deltaproteobacteria bacterium]|nr:MAG: NAD(P)-dependent oxidoreductase [Deltaproteobacteria bacterium]
MKRIVITGATGFLGGALAQQLLARGDDVVALARATSRTDALERLGASVHRAELTDASSLQPALDGAEVIVHAAGGGFSSGGIQSLYRSNRDTTAALVQAARDCGFRGRFVLVSSVAAQGPSPDGQPLPSDRPPAPRSHYGRAKAEAEALVLADENAFAGTVLRPPTIHGPGDDRLLPLFRAIQRIGVATLPRPAMGSSWIHVADCADAIVRLADTDHDERAVFGVADGPPRAWPQVIATIGTALGRKARTIRIPVPVLHGAATAAEWMGRLRSRPVLFTRDKVSDMQQAWWVSCPLALESAIGWQSRQDFDSAIHAMAQSWRDAGQLRD